MVDRFVHNPTMHHWAYAILEAPIPGEQVLHGVMEVASHNKGGHSEFFMGEWRRTGWWYYFPVVLLLKTPVPFLLLLVLAGAYLAQSARRERDWRTLAPAAFALIVLIGCMPSRINIGLRHVLPIYPMLAMVVGYGASRLWEYRPKPAMARLAAAAGFVCLATSLALAHPNYLAYFNVLVSHPEHIQVDSDLDWGQDLARLAGWLKANRGLKSRFRTLEARI